MKQVAARELTAKGTKIQKIEQQKGMDRMKSRVNAENEDNFMLWSGVD